MSFGFIAAFLGFISHRTLFVGSLTLWEWKAKYIHKITSIGNYVNVYFNQQVLNDAIKEQFLTNRGIRSTCILRWMF